MNPTSRLDNCQESLRQAQIVLNIPATISAEDFSNTDLDFLTRLAYLVQFYAAKRGEPVVLKADVRKVLVSPVNVGEEGGKRIVWVDIDCSQAGHAEVVATVSTKTGESCEVSIAEVKPDQYRVQFACKKDVEFYTLSITYGGEDVNGSPFCVNLAVVDESKVEHLGTQVPTEEKPEVVIGFDTKEAGYGKLTAVATGECAGSVSANLVPKPNGGFDIEFTPPIPDVYSVDVNWGMFVAQAKGHSCGAVPIDLFQDSQKDFKLSFEPPMPDVYTVDVTWGGKPVPGSPFIINLLPPARPEKVEVGDPIYSGAGENVDFLVDLTNAGSGKLTASCTGEKVGEVYTSILSISKRVYQVKFVPPELDIYHLTILFEGVPVQGSPFRINLLSQLQNIAVPQPKYSKEIGTSLVIQVKQRGGEKKTKVTATAYGDATGPCDTQIKKNAQGAYEVTLNPSCPDIYTLDICLNNNSIPNSPFVISFLPRIIPDHSKCKLIDINLKDFSKKLLDVDSNLQFTVDAREAGQAILESFVSAPDKKSYPVEVKARVDEPQVFDISYTPKVPGSHYLKLLWGRQPIPDTPLVIRVVDLEKVQNFTHGKTVVAEIDVPSDVKEKDIRVRIFHVVTGTLSRINGRLSKGKFRVSFNPKLPGLYSIHVLIKDKEIPKSPIVIRYGDPPRPDLCVVQDFPQRVIVDEEINFTVDCTKCGSGELYIKGLHRQLLKKEKANISWKETEDNIYNVTYVPLNTGEHSLLITWAGKPIKGSPYNVLVTEKPTQMKIPTSELFTVDLLSTTPQRNRVNPIPEVVNTTIGNALILKVNVPSHRSSLVPLTSLSSLGHGMKSLFKDDMVAMVVGEKTGQAEVAVKNNLNDTYDIVFTPQEPDRYTITALYKDKAVGSPITAVVTRAPTDSSKVEVVGMNEWVLPVQCFIHQEFKFEVSTKDAGPGVIEMRVEAPNTEEEPLLSINKEGQDRYIIRYIPQSIGVHLLHLIWDGTTIPSSPLTIEVKEPPTVSPGQSGVFEILAGKWKLGDIKATGVHLDTGTSYKVKSTQKKGKYVFTLQPNIPGIYEISLHVGGTSIVHPFRFRFDRPCLPDKVVIFGLRGEGEVNETIKFKADVSDAGKGTLKLEATGPGKPELTLTDNKDDTYSITFRANVPGSYYLNVTWAEEEVPNSPFQIDILDPASKTTVLHELGDSVDFVSGNGQFSGREGNKKGRSEFELNREIDTTDLDGRLEVTAVGEVTGNVDVQLTQIREGVFKLSFKPTKPDSYTISIMVGGKHLPNSPMTVVYELAEMDASKVNVIGLKNIPSLVIVGQKVRLIIDCREAGLSELTVTPKTPTSKEETHQLVVNYFNDDPGIMDVNYIPLVVGKHSLQLLWGKKNIPGSPLELMVCNPQLVTYKRQVNDTMKIGKPLQIEFDTSQAGAEQLTASCLGKLTGDIPVTVTEGKGKTKFQVSFHPKQEDLYVLEVKLGPYHVIGSPFYINLSPIHVDKIIVNGPSRPEGSQGPVELKVNAKAVQDGKLVSVCKYNKKTVSVTVKEIAPKEYLLHFQPPKPAQYIWSVTYNGQDIPNSPFIIDTMAYPELVTVAVPENGSIGQYLHYDIDVTRAGMGTLTATCKGIHSKKVPVDITYIRDGVFAVSVLPLAFDTYSLYVQWSGKEIPNSPFIFTLSPTTHQDRRPISFPLPLPPIDDPSTVEVSCSGEIYGTLPTKLIAVSSSKYRVSFKPQGPDLYTVSILLNGRHVKDSPYIIDLRETKDASSDDESERDMILSTDEGKGIPKSPRSRNPSPSLSPGGEEFQHFIGSAFIVRVRPHNESQRNGELVAKAIGSTTGSAKIDIEQFSEDYFEVNFNPTEPDTYTVRISLNGDPIPRSPFIVHYHKQPLRPSKVRIIGLQDLPSLLDVNTEVSLLIDASKGGPGSLKAQVTGPNDAKYPATLELVPKEEEPDMYSMLFLPTIPGTYTLSLLWGDQHIPHSPQSLRVVDINTAQHFEPGKDFNIDDLEIPVNPTDITAYAVHQNATARLKVKVKEIKKHKYRFIFSAKEPGFYFLHILVHNEELPNSPIPIYIVQTPQPKKCVVKGATTTGYTSEETSMVIDCREGGESTLEVKVLGPKGLEKFLHPINHGDGTYSISHTPSTVGTHHYHIMWGGKHISRSPYRIEVKERQKNELLVTEVTVIDRTEQKHPLSDTEQEETTISTDNDFSFTIRLTEEQRKNLIAQAVTESGSSIKFDVTKIKDGLFKFIFKPLHAGRFFFDFSLGGTKLELPQLPKSINYTEPKLDVTKVKVLKQTIPGLLQTDRRIFFQVDTRLGGNGSLEGRLEGPSSSQADLQIIPTSNKPHFYDVIFTPVEAGVYSFELLWAGILLPGFPFTFDVMGAEIYHGESYSQEITINSRARDITSHAIHTESGEKFKVKLAQVSKGKFRLTFHPKRSGNYNLHVFVAKEEIPGSPFRLNYGKPSQPSKVEVTALRGVAKVNTSVKYIINVKKAGDGDLNIKLVGPQLEAPKIFLREKKSGIYEAEFTPQVPGQYSTEITWSGESVPRSPFLVTVKEKSGGDVASHDLIGLFKNYFDDGNYGQEEDAEAIKSQLLYSAKSQPKIPKEDLEIFGKRLSFGKVSFRIAHEGHSGSLDIRSEGPEDLKIRTIEGADMNTYEVEPSVAGKYVLTILLNGQEISGGPYFLLFQQPRIVTGLSLEGQTFQVGKSYQFSINTQDITAGLLEIYCKPSECADIRITPVPEMRQYDCSLTPKLVGDFRIGIGYNGSEIHGSPFLVHFKEAAASSLNFHIQAEGIETGDVTAMLESMATQQVMPISLNQLFGGECNLEFLPTEGDEYTLTITCNLKVKREQISGSPFSLSYLPSENKASMCRIEGGGLFDAMLGQWSAFVVNCQDAGFGELTARIEGGDGVEVRVEALSEFMYRVHYLISVEGRYQLFVQWDGVDILGGPFELFFQSATTTTTTMSVHISDVPAQVSMPSPIQFTMKCQEELGVAELAVVANSSFGSNVNGELMPLGEGSYKVIVPTIEVGEYTINIFYLGSPLLQQPISVEVTA